MSATHNPNSRRSASFVPAPANQMTIDISLPRECWLDHSPMGTTACPRCHAGLVRTHQTYCVATKEHDQLQDPFIIGSDFGSFCPQCPTIVIDVAQVGDLLSLGHSSWDIGSSFLVLGQVDLEAIPEDKRNLPFDDDNPLPLVSFTGIFHLGDRRVRSRGVRRKTRSKKSEAKQRRKRARR